MWVSSKFSDWFHISRDTVSKLEQENAALRAENAALKAEQARTTIMNDWLRMQFNQLQMERTALLNAQFNIKLPTPELARTPVVGQSPGAVGDFSFDDWGDDWAAQNAVATKPPI